MATEHWQLIILVYSAIGVCACRVAVNEAPGATRDENGHFHMSYGRYLTTRALEWTHSSTFDASEEGISISHCLNEASALFKRMKWEE